MRRKDLISFQPVRFEEKFMKIINGGITSPKGFKAAGIHAGLKKSKLDMAMIVSETEAVSAGAFTTNVVKAAPVIWDRKILEKGSARAIVVNSGNANACTGEQGLADARTMAEETAGCLGCSADSVFVASTGVIGVNLDMEKISRGISVLASSLGADGDAAARAILTTDTVKKEAAVTVEIDGRTVTIAGIAKGSGMIHPNMATMLCFITTDAAVSRQALQSMLGRGISDTFNMISVDGDTSTNDSVIVLANGMAGNSLLEEDSDGFSVFEEAFTYVLGQLARMIVRDGEGAGRFIQMKVTGAKSKTDAALMARSVVSSSLVKAAFFGADANWGRILCAMGYSKADFDPSLVDLSFSSAKGEIQVLSAGRPLAFDEGRAKEILLEKEVFATADCHQGSAEAEAWGCDLTYDYVRINGDYRS